MITYWQIFQLILWILVTGLIVLAGYRVLEVYDPGGVQRSIWWGKKWVRIVTAFVVINWNLLLFSPTSAWWIQVHWQYPIRLTFFYLATALGASLMPPNEKTDKRFGVALGALSIVSVLFYLGAFRPFELVVDREYNKHLGSRDKPWEILVYEQYNKYFGKGDVILTGPTSTSTATSATPSELADVTYSKTFGFPPELEGNENARKVYDQLMADESLSKPDRYNLFFVCGEENSFSYSQFEEDGVTPLVGHNREREDNGARGVCQIKPEFHAQTAEELTASTGLDHRIETLEGNVRLASYILRTEGGGRWESLPRVLARANGTATPTATLARRESPAVQVVQVSNPEPRAESFEMPLGGRNPVRMVCSRPTCVVKSTGQMLFLTEGMQDYSVGMAGVPYQVSMGAVLVLDGRGLQSYQKADARYVTITQ